ncbi:hypothetical protein SLEP1_g46136 [Rubroshorea leprosula]|uniref:Uncharacterized protein n=1 Tax=Rubroshorea leprosula TaxID=152421 RepID=A0AAV5LN75_9ROSI|nr:hypothetical protein SLEP1_g46136 [Rubroshorea leprosula]
MHRYEGNVDNSGAGANENIHVHVQHSRTPSLARFAYANTKQCLPFYRNKFSTIYQHRLFSFKVIKGRTCPHSLFR